MKTRKTQAWRILAVLAIAMSAAACSDGELGNTPSPDITPPAPIVITFAADPAAVKAGEATTIKWEVAGADSIQIVAVSSDGTPVNFNVQTEELSGSSPVSGLTADTDFTLTATKTATSVESEGDETKALSLMSGQIRFGEEPQEPDASGGAPAPSISSVTQTITVKVAANDMRAQIAADKSPVAPGEKTVIRWEVTPADGATTVVTADSGDPIVATDQCDGDIATIEIQPALEPMPAKGCAVVAPDAKTVYTVKGSNAAGGAAEASATVDVEGELTAEIFVGKDESDKQKDYSVSGYPQTVTVQWKAAPAAAKVTVTATPAVQATTEAPCELPQAAADKAEASTVCVVSADTVFAISAEMGDATPATDEAKVSSKVAGAAGIVHSKEWAYEGEQVPIKVSLDEETKANSSAVEGLKVNGQAIADDELSSLKAGSEITVTVTANDVEDQVVLVYGGGKTRNAQPVTVVEPFHVDLGTAVAVSSVALAKDSGGNFIRLRGVQMPDFNGGKGYVYVNDATDESVFDFGTAIKSAYDMSDLWTTDVLFNTIELYPVAVGINVENTTDLFAGTSGALMRSQDSGATWKPIFISRTRYVNGNEVDHPTCGRAASGGQNVQQGMQPRFKGDIISLNQVCDVIVKGSRVIVATDFGVHVEKDINDGKDNAWVGTPAVGTDAASIGALTFGHVVNDIIDADGKIFAAMDSGVVVSDAANPGIGWKETGIIAGPVFALAYDSAHKKVYAGTEEAVFVASAEDAEPSWIPLTQTGPVTAIAIDPSTSADEAKIIIGTPTGVKISRDGGMTFNAVALFADTASVRSIALETSVNGSKVKGVIMIGSDKGMRFNSFSSSKAASATNGGAEGTFNGGVDVGKLEL